MKPCGIFAVAGFLISIGSVSGLMSAGIHLGGALGGLGKAGPRHPSPFSRAKSSHGLDTADPTRSKKLLPSLGMTVSIYTRRESLSGISSATPVMAIVP